jgi:hypothetical protein
MNRTLITAFIALSITGSCFLPNSAEAQTGIKTYLVRRVYQAGQTQQFNVTFNLKGEIRSSNLDHSMPMSLTSLMRMDTKILSVLPNGQARMEYSIRYTKNIVDYLEEEELPKPSKEVLRITPSGFPAEDDTKKKLSQKKKASKPAEEEEPGFPGLPFLLDPQEFLIWIGFEVVPGPFYPTPPRAMSEGDQWGYEIPTPFLDTDGGIRTLDQATAHTYPVTTKIIGMKEVQGRPALLIRQTIDTKLDIPLDDTLLELVRLENRVTPKGKMTGTLKGTTDYYLALSDGALIQANGSMEQKLRVEYDRQTILSWQPDEEWAEWDVKVSFTQKLANMPAVKPSAPAKKTPAKPNPKKKK